MKQSFAWFVILVIVGVFSGCMGPTPEPTPQPPTETPTITPTFTATIDWFPATATATRAPTQTPVPTPNMRTGLDDVMQDDAFATGHNWQTGSFPAGNITVTRETLTLAVQQSKGVLFSLQSKPLVADFDMQVQVNVSLCRGEDAYGLVVRAAGNLDYYRFLVTCNGLARADRVRNGQTIPMQDWTTAAMFPGAPIDVRLGVWALGNEMRFFVNEAYIFSVKDPVFPNGVVGVFARSAGENALTVNYTDLVIRKVISTP
ncbi:MAG: hypothetical protein CVU39_23300 [Chloroflexi bacterium HGW-Chloroflexi-10]|nr:MAG: hypothetical protein CVU39_23300 [Chloroflexi bacterium HGW-Chloroflexi-10]